MKNIICIFAKPPLPGKTKSRLAEFCGNDAAAKLSGLMLQSLINESVNSCADKVVLWGSPNCNREDFENIDLKNISFEEQIGDDLGDRMSRCFQEYLLNSNDKIILIGSDCISQTRDLLNNAFNILSNCEVIIQPAFDGGYVLIGQSKYTSEIFKGIPWGGSSVFLMTKEKLDSNKNNYEVLPQTFDVDTKDDLKQLHEFALANSNKDILSWFQKNLPF